MWVWVPGPYFRCLSLFCCSAMPFPSVAIGVGNDAGKNYQSNKKNAFRNMVPLNLWAVFGVRPDPSTKFVLEGEHGPQI